jgi:hypothetical protein
MQLVTLPRSFRPRLLLLPLVLGLAVAPVFLRTAPAPATQHELAGETLCSNHEDTHERRPLPDPLFDTPGPSCAHCRAPLLNAPLAQIERDAPQAADGALPPAA